jgi:hypothetical protein
MQSQVTHILPRAAIRRERLMAADGRIIARRGQQVQPADIVAEAKVRPEHLLLDIGRGLGLSSSEADHYIQRRAGDEVGEGDVIAGPVGLTRRLIRTPRAGTVVVAGGGQVLLELEGEISELKAGYSGLVADIIGERGVVIEAVGSLIQGVWGNGKINFGLLNVLAKNIDEIVTPSMMDVSLRGAVVIACHCEDERVLTSAEELPVRGIILASMNSALVPTALNMSYPILLVEGFGKLPMNQDAFHILTSGSMREVSVNAESWNRITNNRPEALIALPDGTLPEATIDSAAFSVGQSVRVVSPPYKSMLGTLTNLLPGLSVLPNGLKAQAAGVRLLTGDTVQVPLSNLEIIG